jgi:SPP1 gp7 family putative phage head morphogenesis protein
MQKLHSHARYGQGSPLPTDLIKEGEALITETATLLNKAMKTGIGNVTYAPDPEFIAKLTKNVWVFSGFKTYDMLSKATDLLMDASGKLKPWNLFRDDVLALNKTYNENYLKAEYNHAVTSSQMAAKWKKFEQDGDRYYLQYRTAQDERVRASHKILDKITLPVGDPFWDSYLPPNGWNCRCTTVQVLKSKYKPDSSTDALQRGEQALTVYSSDGVTINQKATERNNIFKFNPGKQAAVFPTNHPYYKVQNREAEVIKNHANEAYYNTLRQDYAKQYNLDKWPKDFTLAEQIEVTEHLNLQEKISFIAKKIVYLKNEIAFLLDAKGNLISRATGVSGNVDFNLFDDAILKDSTIIHNHPENNHLSLKDTTYALEKNILIIAAVNDDKIWLLDRPKKGWPDLKEFDKTKDELIEEIADAYANDEITYYQYKDALNNEYPLQVFKHYNLNPYIIKL